MCEQCAAATVTFVSPDNENVLPGYSLVRATIDGNQMKKYDWGLVVCNDPDYIWTITPVCDPHDGLSDEQIDAMPDCFDNDNYKDFEKAALHLRTKLDAGDFDNAIRLGEAMKKAGYNYEEDGTGCWWLCNHIAKFLKTAVVRKDNYECA